MLAMIDFLVSVSVVKCCKTDAYINTLNNIPLSLLNRHDLGAVINLQHYMIVP